MSTENKVPRVNDTSKQFLQRVLDQLDESTVSIPTETTLSELQVCIERLTFHMTANPNEQTISQDTLVELLQTDVSKQTRSFVEWAIKHDYTKLFIGKVGRVFLSYCTDYYRNFPEITVQTPLPLSETFAHALVEKLRTIHPYPARIIFLTERSLIAGCIITTPTSIYDYSLKRSMTSDIARFTKAHMKVPTGAVRG